MDCIICGKSMPESKGYYCIKNEMKVAFCREEYCDKCKEKCDAKK
jgi:hypothetical protein